MTLARAISLEKQQMNFHSFGQRENSRGEVGSEKYIFVSVSALEYGLLK